MGQDVIILVIAWILTIVGLIIFIPKNKIREAIVIFLFKQLITWIIGLIVAELRLIEYPVREFSYASQASFSFEYFIYPAICVIFNLHYPENKKPLRQFMYYFSYCSAITIVEVLCERYTNIIKYINWEWYVTWISLFITFYMSRKFYLWFFKLNKNKRGST